MAKIRSRRERESLTCREEGPEGNRWAEGKEVRLARRLWIRELAGRGREKKEVNCWWLEIVFS